MRRGLARLLAGTVALLALFLSFLSAPAQAAVTASYTTSPAPANSLFCSGGSSAQTVTADYLPIDRWASAASGLHTDFGGGPFGLGLNDLAQRIQRDGVETGALTAGNTLWQAGTDLAVAAENFCFAHSLGQQANSFAAAIAKAVFSSGIVAAMVALAIISFLWHLARRGEKRIRSLTRAILVTAILAVLVEGGSSSSSTTFAPFSPGWVVTTLYSAISNVVALPTTKLAQLADKSLGGFQAASPNLLGCTDYTDNLLAQYKKAYGAGAGVPMALDAMWEQTGLRAYEDIQFGPQASSSTIGPQVAANHYGLRVDCRVLDERAGIPPSSQASQTTLADGGTPVVSNSSAAWLAPTDSNSTIDASIIAWAACKYSKSGGWSVSPEFASLTGGHKVTVTDCQTWWSTPASSWSPGPFHWSTSLSAINSYASSSPQVANFLVNWHGDANGQAMATAVIFLPASIAAFGVFLVLAGALLIAKMALLVVIMLVPIMLVLSLLPGPRWEGGATKLAKYGTGLVVFSVLTGLVLSVAAVISSFLVQAGASLFGPGSVMTVLWAGLAPFAAIWLMHHLFKTVGAPSPFKLNGALGWAAAAGGIGVGVGETLHNRTAGKAYQSLKMYGKSAGKSAQQFVTKPKARVGGLQPSAPSGAGAPGRSGSPGGLAGAGAAGVAAGAVLSKFGKRQQSGAGTNGAAPGAPVGTASVGEADGAWSSTASQGDQNVADRGASTDGHATGRAETGAEDEQRTWLDVPVGEEAQAEAAGAKWDSRAGRWYAPRPGTDELTRWLPRSETTGPESRDAATSADSEGQAPEQPTGGDGRIWLDVPDEESEQAQAAGAQWDAGAESWYATQATISGLSRWAPELSPKPRTVSDALFDQVNAEREKRAAARYYKEVIAGPPPVKQSLKGAGVLHGAAAFAGNRARGARYKAKVAAKLPAEAVRERWREASARFQQAPVRNTLKAIGVGAGTVLLSPASVPMSAAVVGGILAARHARRAHIEHSARKAFKERQRIEAWRAAQVARAEQDRKEQAARRAAEQSSSNQDDRAPEGGVTQGRPSEEQPQPPDGPGPGEATGDGAAGSSGNEQPRSPEGPPPAEDASKEAGHRRPEPAPVGVAEERGAQPVSPSEQQPTTLGATPRAQPAGPAQSSGAQPGLTGQQASVRRPVTGATSPDELWRRTSAPTQPPVRPQAETPAPGVGGGTPMPASQQTPSGSAGSRASLPVSVQARVNEARARFQRSPVHSALKAGSERAVPAAAPIVLGVARGVAAAREARAAQSASRTQGQTWGALYQRARAISRVSRPSTGHEHQPTT